MFSSRLKLIFDSESPIAIIETPGLPASLSSSLTLVNSTSEIHVSPIYKADTNEITPFGIQHTSTFAVL